MPWVGSGVYCRRPSLSPRPPERIAGAREAASRPDGPGEFDAVPERYHLVGFGARAWSQGTTDVSPPTTSVCGLRLKANHLVFSVPAVFRVRCSVRLSWPWGTADAARSVAI
jgi:hypothetical protein